MERYHELRQAMEKSDRLLQQSVLLLVKIQREHAQDLQRLERTRAAIDVSEQFMRTHELHFLAPSPFLPHVQPLFPARLVSRLSEDREEDAELSVP